MTTNKEIGKKWTNEEKSVELQNNDSFKNSQSSTLIRAYASYGSMNYLAKKMSYDRLWLIKNTKMADEKKMRRETRWTRLEGNRRQSKLQIFEPLCY